MPVASERSEPATGVLAPRDPVIDGVRGFAVLLMVADHVAALLPELAPWGLREVVTRFALPLFFVTAGYLGRPAWTHRHVEVALVALGTWPLVLALLGASVPILVVYVLSLPACRLAHRWPVPVGLLAVLQLSAWPIPWGGYQPGAVVAFYVLGTLLPSASWRSPWLAWASGYALCGRWPLTLYAGHLAVLAVAVVLTNGTL